MATPLLSVLHRKLLRDLWALRGQVVAIALVLGSGLAVLIMSLGAIQALTETRQAFYERYRFAEVFVTVKRAPLSAAAEVAALPGVRAAEARVVRPVILDLPDFAQPISGTVVSVPADGRPALNDLVLRAGRWPQGAAPDEVIVNERFAAAHRLTPGATVNAVLNGRLKALRVVGIALSPEFVYTIGPGQLMPDDARFGILWMEQAAAAAAFGMEGAFNDLSVALTPAADVDSVIDALDARLARYGGTGAYPRSEQVSNWFLSGEIDQLGVLATLLPTIFLSVAAFLLHVAGNRLIATEQSQIGLLKAFGFTNAQVAGHYARLMVAMALPGVLLGWAGGAVLGRWLTEVYTLFYGFPFLIYRPDPGIFALAGGIGVGAALSGGAAAVLKAVRLRPAEAMQPPPPPVYRRMLISRVLPATTVDQPSLMILRHVTRWPLRSGMTILGMALATGVLVVSLQWVDAIDWLLERQFFTENRQDATLIFSEVRPLSVEQDVAHLPAVLAAEGFRSVPARLHVGHVSRREPIRGLPAEPRLGRVLDAAGHPLTPPPQGLLLSRKLATLLGAAPGTLVTVEVLEGRRPVLTVPVAAIADTYIGMGAWMRLDALWRVLDEAPSLSGVHLSTDAAQAALLDARLKEVPAVAGIAWQAASLSMFRQTAAQSMLIMVGFYVAFSSMLTFGVVYNSARIALSERSRELATLRVLGFSQGEVAYILTGELALLTLLSLPLGCLTGWGLAEVLSRAMDTELYRVPAIILPHTLAWACLGVTAAAAVSAALVVRQLRRLDLVGVLKTRE